MRQAFDEKLSRKHMAFVVSNEQLCSLDTHSTLCTKTKMSSNHQSSVELTCYSTLRCYYLCHMNAAPLPVYISLHQSMHELAGLNLSAISIVATALDKLRACKNPCLVRNKSETFIST